MLKLVLFGKRPWSYNKMAVELGMSSSEVHAAAKRAIAARLAIKEGDNIRPNIRNLEEFLLQGVQYVFVPDRGGLCRGMPTAHSAAPMDAYIVADNEPPLVWPAADGEIRGMSFSSIYESAPLSAKNDPQLYELLVLVDVIRDGRAKENVVAAKELKNGWMIMSRTHNPNFAIPRT